jgi:hypothetical protein
MSLWPPLPPPVGMTPQAVAVLVALPELSSAWGRTTWGVGRWGGWDFGEPTPMDCDVQGLEIERGRSDALDHVSAGGLRVTLADPDRQWAPWVVPPNGFRAWRTGVPIQARTPDGYLLTGAVTEIHASEQPEADFERTVEIVALDPLTFLATTDGTEQAEQGANELAGARLERVWANASPPGWVEHDFDPGVARMQATTLANAALTEMWLTADSDAGMLTCTPDGVVRYWDTHDGLTQDRRVIPQVTFTDDDDYTASTPVVCTTKFDVVDDQAPVINWIGIAAAGGTQQVATDAESVSWYGRRTTHRNDLIHAEGDAFSAQVAQTFLTRVTRSSVVVSPLVFNALATPEAWDAAHFLDIGDRVAVHRSASGERLDITASIDQITHQITPTSWQTTVQLAPGTQRTAYTRWGTAHWGHDNWS